MTKFICPTCEEVNDTVKKEFCGCSDLKSFYFTFGQAHVNNKGEPMKDYWVRVEARDAAEAHNMFVKFFGDPYLPRRAQYSSSYTKVTFSAKYFPGGEYAVIDPETEKDE